jgi:hypothetical protein
VGLTYIEGPHRRDARCKELYASGINPPQLPTHFRHRAVGRCTCSGETTRQTSSPGAALWRETPAFRRRRKALDDWLSGLAFLGATSSRDALWDNCGSCQGVVEFTRSSMAPIKSPDGSLWAADRTIRTSGQDPDSCGAQIASSRSGFQERLRRPGGPSDSDRAIHSSRHPQA